MAISVWFPGETGGAIRLPRLYDKIGSGLYGTLGGFGAGQTKVNYDFGSGRPTPLPPSNPLQPPPIPTANGNFGAYWNMEGPDANTFSDVSPTGANLTTSGAGRIVGQIGHGVSGACNAPLTGLQTSGGGTPTLAYRGNGISISFWAKFNGIVGGGSSAAVMVYKIGGASVGLFFSSSTGAAVDFILDQRNGTQYSIAVTPDVWYHWVWAWRSNGTYTVYQNAQIIASIGTPLYTLTAGTGAPAFAIGAGTGGIGRQLIWFVDELGLWCDYTLNASNVAYLYNSGAGITYPLT